MTLLLLIVVVIVACVLAIGLIPAIDRHDRRHYPPSQLGERDLYYVPEEWTR